MSDASAQTGQAQARLQMMIEIEPRLANMPPAAAATYMLKHGGLQAFYDRRNGANVFMQKLKDRAASTSEQPLAYDTGAIDALAQHMEFMVTTFFTKLEKTFNYSIDSALMSYLSMPGDGIMFSKNNQSSSLSAVVTFIGQFVDHDLTKNATNLTNPEADPVVDVASPYIDLDSVYGPRSDEASGVPPMKANGTFVLTMHNPNAYDVPRNNGMALIADTRNDENQIILQIHMLLMRVHNLLIKEKGLNKADAQRETIYNWQSVLLNYYLPLVLEGGDAPGSTLQDVITNIQLPNYGNLKHKPPGGDPLKLQMPHEFAIGFRFGHSQLRSFYRLNPDHHFVLFDNLDPGPDFKDLRGNRALKLPERAIDWDFFINPNHVAKRSNRIDTDVISNVFNLPESAIPDDIKFIGNLPHRNFIRSREIGLTSGEKLYAVFFGGASGKLDPQDVEPDPEKRKLFHTQGGHQFETPLWYYILREAELGGGETLGKLGSRLVAEVVVGGIYYGPVSFMKDAGWNSKITNTRVVTIQDLTDFVKNKDAS